MCNAWNHSYSCPCAFGPGNGGGWHRSTWTPRDTGIFRAQDVTYTPIWGSERRTTVASYVNPNAHCPVCGASVFFYRSPYNGRVFFDDLGWPWPKHRCTDNGQEPRRRTSSTPRSEPAWKADGWHPLVASRVHVSAKDRVITGDIDGDYQQLTLTAHSLIDAQSPIFVRPIAQRPGLFEVTYLSSDMIAIQPRNAIACSENLRGLDSDVIAKAAAGKADALYTVGSFLLWALEDAANAMHYLQAAAEGGAFDAPLDLCVLGLFAWPEPDSSAESLGGSPDRTCFRR
jgi:hypothetical protein